MLEGLRRRLTLAYTSATWLVLTAVLLVVLFITESQLTERNLQTFQNQVDSIVNKLETEKSISTTWLAQMEAGGGLMIHIEENGYPFFFSGAWTAPTPRETLMAQVQALALAEEINPAVFPLFAERRSSSILSVTGETGEAYHAMVTVLPREKGWMSLTVIKYDPASLAQRRQTRLFLAAFDLAALFLLLLVNWRFIGKSLKPVEESRRKQTDFVAAASHELRSPLAVIRASASAIGEDPADRAVFQSRIDAECRRMGRLIDDMLLLANADASNWSIRKEAVDMDTLLIETYERYLPLCREAGIHLDISLPETALPQSMGDRERLQQILAVLLDNAKSYTPAGGRITIRAGVKGRKLRIEVADTGVGIPEAVRPHIFERFYRAEASRSSKDHFGLGLSVAMELMQLHGGTIDFYDTPGGGTTFVLALPLPL